MRMNAFSQWFLAIILALAAGVATKVLGGAEHLLAHAVASILFKLAVPGLYMAHLASEFFPPQRARAIQWLVCGGILALLAVVVVAFAVPALSMPLVHVRIWSYVAIQLGIVLGVVALGTIMAMNYLRVPSGRFRGIALLVMVALAASIPWMSWDVAAMLAVLLLSVRVVTYQRG